MANLIGSKPNQVPTNGSLGTMAFQDADNANLEKATIEEFDGFLQTAIYPELTGVGQTPVPVFTVGNTRAVYLVSVEARSSDSNLYSTATYILTVGAYDKELNILGAASNHFSNGTVVLSLTSGSAASVDVQAHITSGSQGIVNVRSIKLISV